MSPMIIAHRGASGYAPENTMASFQMAQKLGSQGIELDVQLTKDGVPVVIHDELLDRTTNLCGQVSTYTWEELRQADAGSWMGEAWREEKVPALEEVLDAFSGMFLNIELKNSVVSHPGLEEKVISLITRYCDLANVILSSFNPQSVQRIKQLAPEISTGFLYETEPEHTSAIGFAVELLADAVHPDYQLLTEEKVYTFHEHGLLVNTWTVNDPEEMKKMVRMGVNGIITNYPDRLKELIDSLG